MRPSCSARESTPPRPAKYRPASPTVSTLGGWSLTSTQLPAARASRITGCVPPPSAGATNTEARRVRAAGLGRRDEHVGVALELPVAAAEDVAGEDDARVALAHHRADVVV